MKSHWNYRIVLVGDCYELHEVCYHDGVPWARTQRPFVCCETRKEVITNLKMMLKDAKRFPVMEDSEIGGRHES